MIQIVGTLKLDLAKVKRAKQDPKLSRLKVQKWRRAKRSITHSLEYLRTILEYDPNSGNFVWLVGRHSFGGKVCAGEKAGCVKADGKDGRHDGGYIQIGIDQRLYRAHRLAWWFMTGTPPPKGIDVEHENRDRADNKWKNLRLATRSQNNCNAKNRADNTSGYKGVHRVSGTCPKPWFARITINKRIIHLGCFNTIEEAAEARRLGEIKYHGEFRRKS